MIFFSFSVFERHTLMLNDNVHRDTYSYKSAYVQYYKKYKYNNKNREIKHSNKYKKGAHMFY